MPGARDEPASTGPIWIIVPAYNEEAVIRRCLDGLTRGAAPGEVHVVVACNGCHDRTADAARAFDGPVTVVETATASKVAALNLGDAAAGGFPRLYVDADVVLTIDDVRRIVAVLRAGAPAAAPCMRMDFTGASWGVRAYYRIWQMLPYTREGMIGVGSYALSEQGRGRFGEFPDVIADDGYVRALFAKEERPRVEGAFVTVAAPHTLPDLLKIKTRSRLGGYELTQRFPELMARERAGKPYGGAAATVLVRPWLWPHALVYAGVNLLARRRAGRRSASRAETVWERDESTRTAS